MKLSKSILFLCCCFCLWNHFVNGQPTRLERNYYTHFQSWTSFSVRNNIAPKLDLQVFALHWRQSVYEGDYNIFRGYQMQAYELWLHYVHSENFTFSITPFGYYHEVPLAEDGWHFLREPQYEYRFTLRALNTKQYGALYMDHRFGFEYRHRTSLQEEGVFWPEYRLLYRIRLARQIFDNWDIIFRNEIFIAFGRYIQYNLFDLNIAFLGFEHEFSDHFRLSIGYANFFEPLRSGQDFNISHALNIGVSLRNIFPIRSPR